MTARVASASVGLPLLALAIWMGPPWFSILAAAAAAIGALEFCQLARGWGSRPIAPLAAVWALGLVAGAHLLAAGESGQATLPAVAGAALASAVWVVLRFRPGAGPADWGLTAVAVLYTGGLLAHAPLLRGLDQGREWVFFVLMVTFAADTAAFFVGRAIGKTPLAPATSPGKTWEGAAAGLVAATGAGGGLATAFALDVSLAEALLLGATMGVVGQAGDLMESKLKRIAGAKDSGGLIPGHGGVLDRLDSIVFNLALVYYFSIWAAS